ncbi:MAG TPA: carboxypeptidase-like regulatory domain-containing protein [Chthoniobacterales bacterium]|nr:carboxypeptidase-like regulatory domain-containing protein [Chthoniobacterales bacterium]
MAWAGAALEGTVKSPDGHPIKNAQVRVESKGGKFAKTITTDAKGHYFCDGLTAGTNYNVALVVNGSVKASILSTRVQGGKPTALNFDLQKAKGTSKKHMVWVPTETGTHIGAANGHWIEVDDNGQPVNPVTSMNDVERTNSNYAKQLENNKTTSAVGK